MAVSASTGRRPRRGVGGGVAVDVTLAVFVQVTVAVAIIADLQPDARAPNALAYVLGVALAAPIAATTPPPH
ncbi:MAG TPA: hypothetical protein VKP11_03785 [Frankiaceae bacterium]|nr:hypothetical protein [Frankiaceae bacterium]